VYYLPISVLNTHSALWKISSSSTTTEPDCPEHFEPHALAAKLADIRREIHD
jgi:hypothetical protein